MSDPETAGPSAGPAAARSALESLTLRGAATMAAAFAASKVGLNAGDGAVQAFAEALINLAFCGGALAVGVGRARARGPLA